MRSLPRQLALFHSSTARRDLTRKLPPPVYLWWGLSQARAVTSFLRVFSYFSLGWGVATRRGLRDKESLFHFCHEGTSVMTFMGG
jgi:hypothetical protein